jgi:hypothetical protein
MAPVCMAAVKQSYAMIGAAGGCMASEGGN